MVENGRQRVREGEQKWTEERVGERERGRDQCTEDHDIHSIPTSPVVTPGHRDTERGGGLVPVGGGGGGGGGEGGEETHVRVSIDTRRGGAQRD